MVGDLNVRLVCEVFNAQQTLHVLRAVFREGHRLELFVEGVILFVFQLAHDPHHRRIQILRLRSRTGDDQRRARFVDEDRVHLVDDRIMQRTLHHVALMHDHVVAQIVEAELVVRAVGDVAVVRILALHIIQPVHDQPDRQTQEVIQRRKLLGVAASQIVVDRDNVDALSFQRVQIHRTGRHQRFPFTSFHFGDAPLVEHVTTHDLHIEMAQPQDAVRSLAHNSEGLCHDIVQRFASSQTFLKFCRFRRKFFVR